MTQRAAQPGTEPYERAGAFVVEAHENLGRTKMHAKDPEGGVAALKEAVRLNPGRAQAFYLLGNILNQGLGRTAEAVEAYDRALAIGDRPDGGGRHNGGGGGAGGRGGEDRSVIAGLFHNRGSALVRLSRHEEAQQVWVEGARRGYWPSVLQHGGTDLQRGLRAEAFWRPSKLGGGVARAIEFLEAEWRVLFDEAREALPEVGNVALARVAALQALQGPKESGEDDQNTDGENDDSMKNKDVLWVSSDDLLVSEGYWRQLWYRSGTDANPGCALAPKSCAIVRRAMELSGGAIQPSAKISAMWGSTHVDPHCGTNTGKLRLLMPLHLPEGGSFRLAVGRKDAPPAKVGKALVFDDSIEHEVWVKQPAKTSRSSSSRRPLLPRIVFILDITHPDLRETEGAYLGKDGAESGTVVADATGTPKKAARYLLFDDDDGDDDEEEEEEEEEEGKKEERTRSAPAVDDDVRSSRVPEEVLSVSPESDKAAFTEISSRHRQNQDFVRFIMDADAYVRRLSSNDEDQPEQRAFLRMVIGELDRELKVLRGSKQQRRQQQHDDGEIDGVQRLTANLQAWFELKRNRFDMLLAKDK